MSAESPPVPPPSTDGSGRRWITGGRIAWLYLACLALLWILSFAVGERNPTVAAALYLPPLIWLAPVPVLLVPGSVRRRRRLLGLLAAAVAVHLGWFMNWRISGSSARPARGPDVLCVVTYNRGEEGKTGIQEFSTDVQPDVIVLQDAGGRAQKYQRDPALKDFTHAQDTGKFTILSRHPIRSAVSIGEMTEPPKGGNPYAVRFEIDFHGTAVAVYTIHMMTPRHELESYKRGAFLYGILGLVPGTSWYEKRARMQRFWDARIADAQFVLDALRAEKLPYVLAGDCNMIERGWLYRRFAELMTDAHAAKGKGYGCSMPGNTNSPLSLFRPWMRLDYIWAGSGWEVLHSETETHRRSQHLAVAAWLKLTPARQ